MKLTRLHSQTHIFKKKKILKWNLKFKCPVSLMSMCNHINTNITLVFWGPKWWSIEWNKKFIYILFLYIILFTSSEEFTTQKWEISLHVFVVDSFGDLEIDILNTPGTLISNKPILYNINCKTKKGYKFLNPLSWNQENQKVNKIFCSLATGIWNVF